MGTGVGAKHSSRHLVAFIIEQDKFLTNRFGNLNALDTGLHAVKEVLEAGGEMIRCTVNTAHEIHTVSEGKRILLEF
jgi:hypothetical protein